MNLVRLFSQLVKYTLTDVSITFEALSLTLATRAISPGLRKSFQTIDNYTNLSICKSTSVRILNVHFTGSPQL